ncbi:hypothetical protein FQA39_LY00583 [Lamprigera yunnana]|nr:hypothetical protein FQA39_LY00583 [Lamprigera yunnana]
MGATAMNLKEEIGESVEEELKKYDTRMKKQEHQLELKFRKQPGLTSLSGVAALTVALRGDAADVLHTFLPEQFKGYAELVKRLDKRSRHAHQELVYRSQLKKRQQKANKILLEFETDVVRLARLAYPTTLDIFLE